MSLRTNFAIHHLLGATEAARRAHKIDEDNKTSELGGWFDSLIHDVSVVIILSSAALEAHVNELITDIIDAGHGVRPLGWFSRTLRGSCWISTNV